MDQRSPAQRGKRGQLFGYSDRSSVQSSGYSLASYVPAQFEDLQSVQPDIHTPEAVEIKTNQFDDVTNAAPAADGVLDAEQPGDRNEGRPGVDARAIWKKALGELQLQLTASTYFTWLHDTWVEGYEDGEFIIATPNPYACDWLQNRLRKNIKSTLQHVVGRMVEVKFIVRPRQVTDATNARPAPLYQSPPTETKARLADAAPTTNNSTSQRSQPTRRQPADSSSLLNANFTFDNFVVGGHNQFAYAAAQAICERPGHRFNPLFIHGGVGLGKTHLLHAIANKLQERGYSAIYCSSEQFTNDLISAIRNQNTDQFRNKYREVDALLIDDIQFISGKESTQEEVFHTFNALHAAGKQVVLSSDRPPKELATLEERLRSRFQGGIKVDISQPDFETRVAILQSKAMRMGIQVGMDVLKLVAERVDSNVRDLEGALNHLYLQAQLTRSALDSTLVLDMLNNVAPQRKPCSPPKTLELVAAHYRLTPEELTGERRTKAVAGARQVAMYLLREDHGLSLPAIGQLLGGRDHTTVSHGIDKVLRELQSNELLRADVTALREKIYTPFIG